MTGSKQPRRKIKERKKPLFWESLGEPIFSWEPLLIYMNMILGMIRFEARYKAKDVLVPLFSPIIISEDENEKN